MLSFQWLSRLSNQMRHGLRRSTRRPMNVESQRAAALETLEDRALLAVTPLGSPDSQLLALSTLADFTVDAGADRLLVVALGDPGSPTAPTAVTFDGTAMIEANSVSDLFFASDAIWYLPLGSGLSTTGDIVVTFAGTDVRFIAAAAYAGVDQTTPVDVGGPASGNPSGTDLGSSLDVPSDPGDLVFDLLDTFKTPAASSITTGAGQTRIHDENSVLPFGFAHYVTSTEPGAALVTMSWTTGPGDGAEGVLHATININQTSVVVAVNHAPAGADKTVAATEDTAFTFAAADFGFTDPDDSPANTLLAVKITTLPGTGTLSNNGNPVSANDFIPVADINSGLLIFTPVADGNGTSYTSFTFQVQDDGGIGGGGVDLDQSANTITVNVTAVADITNDSLTTNEDSAVTANVITGTNGATADTFENPGAAVTSVTQGTNGSVTFNANGSVTYTPDADYNGSDSFTYTVTSSGATETATVNVTINAVADITNDSLTTNEDTAVTANLITGTNGATADTFESGGAALTSVTQGSKGSVTFNANGSVTYTPNADYNGSDSFTYTVTSASLTETATVNVTINAVADITDDSISTNEDVAVTANVITGTNGATADTFESGGAALTSVTQGTNGSVTFNANGSVTYAPDDDFNGSDSFTYTVTSAGLTETATVSVTINPVNDPPTLVNAISDQTADSDAAFNFQFASNTFNDIDVGDSLAYTATLSGGGALPTWLSFDGPNRTFSGTPAESDVAILDVKVTATDTGMETATDTFQLTVRDKTAPVVTPTAPANTNDSTPSITVSATDGASGVVGATVTIDVDLNHSNVFGDFAGELGYSTSTLSGGSATFDLSPALSDGTYGVRARVSDAAANEGTSATQTILVDTVIPTATIVTAQANPTNATSISYTVTFDEAVSNITTDDFDLTLTPVGGGSLTANVASVSAASVTAGGSVTVVIDSITGDGDLVLNLKSGTDITDAATNVVTATSSSAITIDQTKPTADIIDVTPDPRASGVAAINVTFSESVSNVDINDFTLTRKGLPVSLATATLSGGGASYTISGLTSLTNTEGTYVLTLLSSGTGITDAAGNEQDTGATDDWLFLSTSITTSGVSPNKTITITDIGGTTNDDVIITRDPGNANNLLITVEGKTLTVSLVGVSNLVVNTGLGDDKLTLDFSNGTFPFHVTFNGGTSGHDSLVVHNGGAFAKLDATYSNVSDGTLTFTNGGTSRTVTYTGLEPITIDGTPTEVVFNLPSGNDTGVTLKAVGGLLRLAGSTFEDTDFDPAGVTSITINANGGNDTITIGDLSSYLGSLTVRGGLGNDVLNAAASSVAVLLDGGVGNDSLTGSGGNDTLRGGAGNDTLNGGNGTDRGDEIVTGKTIVLTNTGVTGLGKDTFNSIEEFELTGDNSANSIDASAYTRGAVTINGAGGNDTLIGSTSNDQLNGGDGIDTARQNSAGNQTVTGSQIAANATGAGNDAWTSIELANLISNKNSSILDASEFVGDSSLVGGNGNDTLIASQGRSFLNGNAGNDTLTGGNFFDTLFGGAGNDSITGGDGNDVLRGQAGNDTLRGNSGDDRMFGEEGRDLMVGGDGQDLMDGGQDVDVLAGEAGHDTMSGGEGNDALGGGDGDDVINGDAGNDLISGGAGADIIRGGSGGDRIDAGFGNDRIEASGDTVSTGDGDDTVTGSGNKIDEAFVFDFEKVLL